MFALILPLLAICFIIVVTGASYRLGKEKTHNAKMAAAVGFILSFFPPFAVIYLAVLVFREDVDIV